MTPCCDTFSTISSSRSVAVGLLISLVYPSNSYRLKFNCCAAWLPFCPASVSLTTWDAAAGAVAFVLFFDSFIFDKKTFRFRVGMQMTPSILTLLYRLKLPETALPETNDFDRFYCFIATVMIIRVMVRSMCFLKVNSAYFNLMEFKLCLPSKFNLIIS